MLKIGWAKFNAYGLLVGLGVVAGIEAAERLRQSLAKKEKKWRDFSVWELVLWVVGGGVIGARIYHVIDLWSYYSLNKEEIGMIWNGGMGIWGGILGGLVGLGIWSYGKEKGRGLREVWRRWVETGDVIIVGLPLGQAIGRWGNYLNQELYGKPTDLPWGIYIRPENRLVEVMRYERFHPLFLYESIWNLIVFISLIGLIRRGKIKVGRGEVLMSYLGLYGLGRLGLEWLRIESWRIQGVNVAQAISLGLIVAAGVFWGRKIRRKKQGIDLIYRL